MNVLQLVNSFDFVLIDTEDKERLSQFKWRLVGSNPSQGTIRRSIWIGGRCVSISLACEILRLRRTTVDHIDHNRFNNYKANLRVCTRAQNAANAVKRTGVTSQYKGVHWSRVKRAWIAAVSFNHKRICLGKFTTEFEAAQSYNKHAPQIQGNFAVMNTL